MSENEAANVVQLRPHARAAPELEARILGALFDAEDPRAWVVSSGLTAAHFSSPRARTIWQIAEHLARLRRKVDAVTVFSAGIAGRLVVDADAEWLAGLQASNVVTTATAWAQMTGDLRELVHRRQMAERLAGIARGLGEGLPSSVARSQLHQVVQAMVAATAGDDTGATDLMNLTTDWDANNRAGKVAYVPTRIHALDAEIAGFPANLSLIAGQPGIGKSALLGSIIAAQLMADPEMRVGLFGLEDGTAWLARRLVAREMGIPLREVGSKPKTGLEDEKLAEVGGKLHPVLERLTTFRHGRVKAADIVHRASNWVAQGVRCIYIDHLGEVDHSAGGQRWQKDHEGVAETVRQLRDFAVEAQIPVVALAHTARPEGRGDQERPPRMEELAGSSFLERRARLILGLWHKAGGMRATVLKATEGAPGATIEFERQLTAALVDPTGGATVNVNAERAQDRRAKQSERTAEQVRAAAERAKLKAKLEAETKAAESPALEQPAAPQASLFAEPKP